MNIAAYIAAILAFVLAALGAHFDTLGYRELVALGLASFTLGHVIPR